MVRLEGGLKRVYEWLDELTANRLGILRRAVRTFGDARAPQAAASMAYYALFSLFPLLLVLIAAAGFFVEDQIARQEAVALMVKALPMSEELIERNVREVFEPRSAAGIVGLIGLLWSSTGFFSVLAHNVNRAWSGAEPRGPVERRLVALTMIGALLCLLVLSFFSSAVLGLLVRWQVPFWGGVSVYKTAVWHALSGLVPWLFTLLLFLALYRWVPNVRVEWSAVFWSASVVALVWEIAKRAFAWYLSSGLVQYELVYGSLATVVALMVWIYLSSWIALFGAHLGAAIAEQQSVKPESS